MKRFFQFLILLIITLSLTGCFNEVVGQEPEPIPVQVMNLELQERETALKYVGVISSNDLIKYSFKTGGTLASIPVSVGDAVVRNDVLAVLDEKDLKVGVTVAKAQRDAAYAQYQKAKTGASPEEQKAAELNLQKAKDGYEYVAQNLKSLEELYASGALSDNQIKQARLEVNLQKSNYEQAEQMYIQATQGARKEDVTAAFSNYEQAQANYQYRVNSLSEAVLRSQIAGRVVATLFAEGEVIGPGYPVVIVSSSDQVISVGISQKDINSVEIGMKGRANVLGQEIEGELISISEIPNTGTGTYDAKILFTDSSFKIGLVADVELIIGETRGIWIPLDIIQYSGSNYVYLVEDGQVVRKNISIAEHHQGMARVEGLKSGEQLIIANANLVEPGDPVTIIEK